MKLERVFLIPVAEARSLSLEDLDDVEIVRPGWLRVRVDAHSDSARALAERLEEQEIEHWVRDVRHFSEKEIKSANALHLGPKRHEIPTRPASRETYDWSEACAFCMRIPQQTGPLCVPMSALQDVRIARGRRGELVVSEDLARAMIAERIEGCLLRELYFDEGGSVRAAPWFQVLPIRPLPRAAQPPTRLSLGDESCPACGLGGLHLDSMLYYDVDVAALSDFNVTHELFGDGAALAPEIVVSPRLFALLSDGGAELQSPEPVLFI